MPERQLSNWLESYLEWTSKSEPPEEFALWSGISALSTALGRSVQFNRGHYTLYPNTYIVLIAGSATCRKSTAVRMGTSMLKSLELNRKVKVIKNSITPEKLVKILGDEAEVILPNSADMRIDKGSEALLFAPELTTLINTKAFQNDLISDLTDLYDCPDLWTRDTKGAGTDELYDVFLNILGATTPDELKDKVPREVIGSGFTSRISFIYKKNTTRSFPHPEEFYNLPHMIELKEKLVHDIAIINKMKGNYIWGEGAKEHFTEWYNSIRKMIAEFPDANLDGYRGRMHDHAIKLAMIISASMSDDMIVTENILKGSILMIQQLEKSMDGVYALLNQSSTIAGDIEWVIKELKLAGGTMRHSRLLQKGYRRFNAQSFKDVMQMLREAEIVHREAKISQNVITYTLVEDEEVKKIIFGDG